MSHAVTALQAARLPFHQVPHTSRLFRDYLYDFSKVQAWYAQAPFARDWAAAARGIAAEAYPAERRARMADALERQNRSFGAGARTLANLERFRAGAQVVITGQQVGLFGGPLYCVLKALTAVKLAAEATAAGVDAVPIFWLAAEDHDLAEVNHVYLAGPAGPRRVEVGSKGKADAPVGSVTFGPEIEQAVNEAAEALRGFRGGGPSVGVEEVISAVRECYAPGENFLTAYARLWTRLTGQWGLILLDASDPELDRVAKPLYAQAIERAGEISEALLARGKELDTAGYHAQVKVTPSSTLLFTVRDGVRTVVHRGHPHSGHPDFTAGQTRYSRTELLQVAEETPEVLSPNALFRPVVQDYLLPTLAYVGGGAEVAYFAQSSVVFDALLGRRTMVLPRISATVIEPKAEKLLAKYGLEFTRVFAGAGELAWQLAQQELPAEVQAAFGSALADAERIGQELEQLMARVDPTLVASAQRVKGSLQYAISRLSVRSARAEVRRNEVFTRHAALLCGTLYPFGGLQERTLSGVEFAARHGVAWLDELASALSLDTPDHQMVRL